MGVKLGIEFPARVVVKTRDDPVARRLDRALAFLPGTSPSRGGFEVTERLGDRLVMGLSDPAVVAYQSQQRNGLGSAEREIPARLMLALLTALEDDAVRQFALQE